MIRTLALPLVLLLGLAGTDALAASRPAYLSVGLLADLSGPARAYGESLRLGLELAFSELNARGGWRGLPYRLVVRDTKQSERLSSAQALDLLWSERVLLLVGTTDSGGTHVVARNALDARCPMVSTVATDPLLTRNGNPWFFRLLPDDVLQAKALAGWIAGAGAKRTAIIHQASRYGREGARAMARAFQTAGGTVSAVVEVEPGRESYAETCRRVLAAGADAVVLWTLYRTGATLTRDLRAAGHGGPICGPDGIANDAYLELAGEAAEGVILTAPFLPELLGALAEDFRLRYRGATGKEADSFAAHGYELGHLLHGALMRGGPERRALRDALACTRDFWGVTGPLRFDGQNNLVAEVHLARIERGRRVALPSPPPGREGPR